MPYNHKTIARPTGISGYTPQSYCSVCGKTTAHVALCACVSQQCFNSAHVSCLGEETEALGITAPVSYKEDNNTTSSQSSQTDTQTDSLPEDDTADLLELNPSELVDIIRNLRLELNKKNNLVSFYSRVSSNISSARDAAVSVPSFIDNIAANHSSLETFNTYLSPRLPALTGLITRGSIRSPITKALKTGGRLKTLVPLGVPLVASRLALDRSAQTTRSTV